MYGSPEPGFCDVENILLYNVGAGSFTTAKTGIRVERSFSCPPPPAAMSGSTPQHHMRYLTATRHTTIAFTEADGADGHIEPAALGIRGESIFDWLDDQIPA